MSKHSPVKSATDNEDSLSQGTARTGCPGYGPCSRRGRDRCEPQRRPCPQALTPQGRTWDRKQKHAVFSGSFSSAWKGRPGKALGRDTGRGERWSPD